MPNNLSTTSFQNSITVIISYKDYDLRAGKNTVNTLKIFAGMAVTLEQAMIYANGNPWTIAGFSGMSQYIHITAFNSYIGFSDGNPGDTCASHADSFNGVLTCNLTLAVTHVSFGI